MFHSTTVTKGKKLLNSEQVCSLFVSLMGIHYCTRYGFSWAGLSLVLIGVAACIFFYIRRQSICTKVIFDKEQITIHFNQRAVCFRYFEIEKVKVVTYMGHKPLQITIMTNSKKAYVLNARYFDLYKLNNVLVEKLRARQIKRVSLQWFTLYFALFIPLFIAASLILPKIPWHSLILFAAPLFYCGIRMRVADIYQVFAWKKYMPVLRFSLPLQLFMVLFTVSMVKHIENVKLEDEFAMKQTEMLLCQSNFTPKCVDSAIGRAKLYFDVDLKGMSALEEEPIKLTFEHRLVLSVLDRSCEAKGADSCFLLSLIHAKISDWNKSVTYFEKSLEAAKGQSISRLGEQVPYEDYYASRYNVLNKGGRVLASEEYKELTHRHRDLKIQAR